MKEYTYAILVRFKPEEREILKRRMGEAGVRNIAAYIRKMSLDGYVVRLDMSDIKEASRLLRINANNLNQFVKKANETGSIYLEDIKDIKNQQEELWNIFKEILKRLEAI